MAKQARAPLCRSRTAAGRVVVAALVLAAAPWPGLSGAALAHSFTAGLLVTGEAPAAGLAEAVRGFLLAADERDGHANETSDGHIGGIDVQLLPLPSDAAEQVEGLTGTPGTPDVVVVLGPEPAAVEAGREYRPGSAVLLQTPLPEGWDSDASLGDFVARYQLAHGTAPGVMAASAYQAARRLDAAIRSQDGLDPRSSLEEAWRQTASGPPR